MNNPIRRLLKSPRSFEAVARTSSHFRVGVSSMEFTLAFGAVGDFIAVLELIKNIIAALDDSRGSTKAYRDVVQSLGILESTLRQIEKVYHDQDLQSALGELRAIALRNVEQIKRCLADFNSKIEKFRPSLAETKNTFRDAARKVQWKLEEKDVEKFRWELLGHTMAMNTLLELTTLYAWVQFLYTYSFSDNTDLS
ncbi:hypothetical protein CGCA056_v007325 [Colletotrichum aenigma]|uniref:uncharacterized protein n=1 Tax=Colletotrichum aenigma TaxID=1215731 RepID=UPI0018727CA1|nr:uncharacterized protein CGCA056_v007325 [Colletotrichum aenigma]KAF5521751.1 hypothetical protein CGCA056_v007325 [Colletotrichum aenigma]